MVLQSGHSTGVKKGLLVHPQNFCSPAWMEIGGLILWNVTCRYLRNVQDLLSDAKTSYDPRDFFILMDR